MMSDKTAMDQVTLTDERTLMDQMDEALQGSLSRRDRLKIGSVLLAYPDGPDFDEVLEEVRTLAAATEDEDVLSAVTSLSSVPSAERAPLYVSTFDFKESMALYLTAHELGDSRERGGALLRLHAMLRSAALEPLEGELPDYLPLLFEFLAEKPEGMPTEELESRIGAVCRGITERLPKDSPYGPLFQVIASCLPEPQTAQVPAEGVGAATSATAATAALGAERRGAGSLATAGVPAESIAAGHGDRGPARSLDTLHQPADIDNLPYPLVYD